MDDNDAPRSAAMFRELPVSAPYLWPRSGRPLIMGIVNVTPDSFSDGGQFLARDAGLRHAEQLIAEGADLLDIGGESTRPGAAEVSESEELARVIPLLEALRGCGLPLSVDTSKPAVMRAAMAAGAQIINDVCALTRGDALDIAARTGAAVCLMHMQGEPRSMQQAPHYDDVLIEVQTFLNARIAACRAAGIADAAIAIDPGFGFGKRAEHNLRLLNHLDELCTAGYPLLAGLSRKSLIGQVTGRPVQDRLTGSVTLALLAAQKGARILRVHDVGATRDALQLWQAMCSEQLPAQA